MAIFKLDDGSEVIEAVANDDLIEAHKALLVEDHLLIVQGKVQPDRFSGGLRLNVMQVWDLAAARARYGRFLVMALAGELAKAVPSLAEMVKTWPARRALTEEGELCQGLGLRLQIQRETAVAELDLGDAGRFWPTDEALARCKALAQGGRAAIVYD